MMPEGLFLQNLSWAGIDWTITLLTCRTRQRRTGSVETSSDLWHCDWRSFDRLKMKKGMYHMRDSYLKTLGLGPRYTHFCHLIFMQTRISG